MTIEGATISGNFAGNQTGDAGEAVSVGGGLDVRLASSVAIRSSTISGNTAGNRGSASASTGQGGGVFVSQVGAVEISSSMLADNASVGLTASEGGGVFSGPLGSPIDLHNTIVAGNSAAVGPDLLATVDSSYSLVDN